MNNRMKGAASVQMIGGLAGAMIGAAIWAGIVIATGYEVGYVAWGIGLLVGLGVTMLGNERGQVIGISAGGQAVVGLIVAKLLIVEWGAPSQIKAEIMANEELQWMLVYEQVMVDEPELVAQMDVYPDEQSWPQSLKETVDRIVTEKLAALPEGQKDVLAGVYADRILSQYSYGDRIKDSLSFYDALWFFFAVGTAYKMTVGGDEAEPQTEAS